MKNASYHGHGEINCGDGNAYKGEFFEGTNHGRGVFKLADGGIYEGNKYCNLTYLWFIYFVVDDK